MNLEDLKKPFPVERISWRVGSTNEKKDYQTKKVIQKATKGIALAYIDARDVMDRLDEVVGASNWQCKYESVNGVMMCSIGIRVKREDQTMNPLDVDTAWVWKSNGAGETAVEGEKGACSDAFKRAAVLWGIGRYLYEVENVWLDLNEYKKFKNPNDPKLKAALLKASGLSSTTTESKTPPVERKTPVKKKDILTDEELMSKIRAMKKQETLEGLNKIRAEIKAEFDIQEEQGIKLGACYKEVAEKIKEKQ